LSSCVEIYDAESWGFDEPLNEDCSWKTLKEAVDSVERAEIIVRNTSGKQIAWYLVLSGNLIHKVEAYKILGESI
jgi:hypothetical protein